MTYTNSLWTSCLCMVVCGKLTATNQYNKVKQWFSLKNTHINNIKIIHHFILYAHPSANKKNIQNRSLSCTHGWAPFAIITASIQCGMEDISLWLCWSAEKVRVVLGTAIRFSALVSFIFLMSKLHRFSDGIRKVFWPVKQGDMMIQLLLLSGPADYHRLQFTMGISQLDSVFYFFSDSRTLFSHIKYFNLKGGLWSSQEN